MLSGVLDHLQFIYRIDSTTDTGHRSSFRRALRFAYRKTGWKLATRPALQRLVPPEFIFGSQAWDHAVKIFLQSQSERESSSSTSEQVPLAPS